MHGAQSGCVGHGGWEKLGAKSSRSLMRLRFQAVVVSPSLPGLVPSPQTHLIADATAASTKRTPYFVTGAMTRMAAKQQTGRRENRPPDRATRVGGDHGRGWRSTARMEGVKVAGGDESLPKVGREA
ncbi:hypothetical protein NM208_g13262 [Fusarium decemcellulare]|uniref:Uncharacterized protein n=1 Tax=Fusarium decemcellulare TaxID=57161 RepID=A0ACC1RL66_9HYPO|nr:hypothetical protein NM208_g13262 [Fusarium decemcellulare]